MGYLLIEFILIGFQTNEVVGFFGNNEFSNCSLAPNGINGDDTTGNIKQFEQFRDGFDLVSFIRYLTLGQAHTFLLSPDTDNLNRRLFMTHLNGSP